MANRYFKQFQLTPQGRQISLAGQISLAANASVTSHDIPLVESVVKSDTGEYTITLQDKYVASMAINLTLESAEEDVAVRITSQDVSSSKEIVIRTEVAGVTADVSSAAKIHVSLVLRDSSVKA